MIINSFNDRWFQGWDATPEDQRVKFVSLAKSIQAHPDYVEKYSENADAQNREIAFNKIFNEVMAEQRKIKLNLDKKNHTRRFLSYCDARYIKTNFEWLKCIAEKSEVHVVFEFCSLNFSRLQIVSIKRFVKFKIIKPNIPINRLKKLSTLNRSLVFRTAFCFVV